MAEDTSQTSNIVIDREEQRKALGRVYSLLLRLAAQREAADECHGCEVSEPATAAEASAAQPDGLAERPVQQRTEER
jgi:hypothetical protein